MKEEKKYSFELDLKCKKGGYWKVLQWSHEDRVWFFLGVFYSKYKSYKKLKEQWEMEIERESIEEIKKAWLMY